MIGPGIHDGIPAAVYHDASAMSEQPCLSAGICKLLIERSPLHAWTAHPRLNPNYRPIVSDRFDVGSVVHEMVLRGEDIAVVVEGFDDWRKKEARELRDSIRADGKIPLLAKDSENVHAMDRAVRDRIAALDIDPPLFADGKPERTVVWEEDGVMLKARLDWLRDDLRAVDDLKSTSATANPLQWCRRTLWTIGADLQVVMYRRAVKAVTGVVPDFRYVVVETSPPYALSVVSLAPSALEFAEAKLDRAIGLWRDCLAADSWPSYPREIAYAELPPWAESQWWEMDAAMAEAEA